MFNPTQTVFSLASAFLIAGAGAVAVAGAGISIPGGPPQNKLIFVGENLTFENQLMVGFAKEVEILGGFTSKGEWYTTANSKKKLQDHLATAWYYSVVPTLTLTPQGAEYHPWHSQDLILPSKKVVYFADLYEDGSFKVEGNFEKRLPEFYRRKLVVVIKFRPQGTPNRKVK